MENGSPRQAPQLLVYPLHRTFISGERIAAASTAASRVSSTPNFYFWRTDRRGKHRSFSCMFAIHRTFIFVCDLGHTTDLCLLTQGATKRWREAESGNSDPMVRIGALDASRRKLRAELNSSSLSSILSCTIRISLWHISRICGVICVSPNSTMFFFPCHGK
jgi:hypothetical protein